MKWSLKSKCLILFVFVVNSIGLSQHSQVYNYNSFLQVVKKVNPLLKKAENTKAYGELQLKAASGNFDPQLSSGFDNKQFNSYNYFTWGSAEIKQPLYTSQYLKIGYQYGQGLYLNPEKNTPLAGLPYIGLETSVIQGLMFDKRRAELIKAKHYSDYYTADQKIQYNDLMLSASSAYAETLYLKEIRKIFTYFSNLAAQRYVGITYLSKAGEKAPIDTIEAAIFLQGRLLDKQSGEIEFIKKLNDLSVLCSNSGRASISGIHFSDSLESLYSIVVKNMNQGIVLEENINPVISQYIAKQKILDVEKKLRREMIKPVLDVNYNFLGFPENNGYKWLNGGNYKWGASFSFPLFLRKARNEYKMAMLDATINEWEIINKRNQIDYKKNYLLEAVKTVSAQITNAEKSVFYAQSLMEAEKLKFLNGESSLFLLNTRENKWLETELKLAEYRLKFIKLYLELKYYEGNLTYELEF